MDYVNVCASPRSPRPNFDCSLGWGTPSLVRFPIQPLLDLLFQRPALQYTSPPYVFHSISPQLVHLCGVSFKLQSPLQDHPEITPLFPFLLFSVLFSPACPCQFPWNTSLISMATGFSSQVSGLRECERGREYSTSFLLHVFICRWTFRLLPSLSYCK